MAKKSKAGHPLLPEGEVPEAAAVPSGWETPPISTTVEPLFPVVPEYDVPGWFVEHHKPELDELVSRARASGKEESTAIRTSIIGSGNMGTVVLYSDGTRVWSPHNSEIDSWFGHLRR